MVVDSERIVVFTADRLIVVAGDVGELGGGDGDGGSGESGDGVGFVDGVESGGASDGDGATTGIACGGGGATGGPTDELFTGWRSGGAGSDSESVTGGFGRTVGLGSRGVRTAIGVVLERLVVELCPFGVDGFVGGEGDGAAGVTISAGARGVVVPAFEIVAGTCGSAGGDSNVTGVAGGGAGSCGGGVGAAVGVVREAESFAF